MERSIPGTVYNELRLHLKKGEAITYVKNLCEQYKENIEEFTASAIKAAFDYNRSKALDYMLGLQGRHKAHMLLNFHVPAMMYSEKKFIKGAKIFQVLIKHYDRSMVLEQIENAKTYKVKQNQYSKEIEARYKEMMYMVFSYSLKEKNIKTKTLKI